MTIFTKLRRWLISPKATPDHKQPSNRGEAEDSAFPLSATGSIPLNETRPTYVYDVFFGGELKYQFMESIWYDTASPAQGCIAALREIKAELPGAVIRGFGKEYKINTLDDLKLWTKHVFSPTGCSYGCDFSEYL